jgi:capsular polysaccharide biosynthesis protein
VGEKVVTLNDRTGDNVMPAPGAKVGILASEMLPSSADFPVLVREVVSPQSSDLVFRNAPTTRASVESAALRRGINLFGADAPEAMRHFKDGVYHMRAVETVVLKNAIYSPRSATICKVGAGFYRPSLENFPIDSTALARLAANDPLYQFDSQRGCRFSEEAATLTFRDTTAVPVCGTGFPNYGHFLYDGLPIFFLLLTSISGWRPELVGPPLLPWQREVLDVLGIADLYYPLTQPTVFSKIVTTNLISLHVAYPTRFIRPLFDAIRLKAGSAGKVRSRNIFVSRGHTRGTRHLVNRAEVEECFRESGFDIVAPEFMPFLAQVRLFSSCTVVASDTGAGFANIGFCDPGTKVLEIQPVDFLEGWTRSSCMILGHQWHVLFADSKVLYDRVADQSPRAIDYSVDISELRLAIRAITGP